MRGGKRRMMAPILLFLLILVAGITQADPKPSSLQPLDKIAKDYKIDIVTAKPQFPVQIRHGKINGTSASAKMLDRYAGLFAAEFTLYPRQLVTRSKLKRVVLCTHLSFAGQRRNAVPDFENDTLYLDVHRGAHNTSYLRTVIHHEFFHILDYRDDGLLYRDERWSALNMGKLKYGTGGRTAQNIHTTWILTDKWPGFLNHYSTTAVEEDKAEIFAHLIVHPAYVAARAKQDPMIRAKVQRMHEMLADFCPAMNEKFWEKVHHRKRKDP